jgi:predicted PurR-regulated permease PerM
MPDMRETPKVFSISTATIVTVLVFGLALAFLWQVRYVLVLFFIAFILSSILNPVTAWFERRRLSRALGVTLIYMVGLTIVGLILRVLIPIVIIEARDLITNADDMWSDLLIWLGPFRDFIASHGLSADLNALAVNSLQGLGSSTGRVVTTVRGLFTGAASVVIVLVVAFWLLMSDELIKRFFSDLAPAIHRPYVSDLFDRIEKALGSWVRAQLTLSLLVGAAVYLMLMILGVKYALVLAVLAALGETVPYLGPLAAAVPGVLIALTISPTVALVAAIVYYAIHLTESHFLIPKVMHKATGLHPVVCIFALLVGVETAGVVGAFLAIPVATVLSVPVGDALQSLKKLR